MSTSIALTGLVAGVVALALTGWVRGVATVASRWVSSRAHVPIAAVGGVGAALLSTSWTEVAAFGVLGVAFALLMVVDLAEHRLPDVIVLPMYPIFLVLLTISAAVDGGWGDLGRAVAAGAILFTTYFMIAFAYPPGMGLGDVKLAGLLGIFLGWLGWSHVLLGTVVAFLLNALVSLVLLLARRVGRKGEVPFGPSMVVGAAVGAAWGPLVFTGVA